MSSKARDEDVRALQERFGFRTCLYIRAHGDGASESKFDLLADAGLHFRDRGDPSERDSVPLQIFETSGSALLGRADLPLLSDVLAFASANGLRKEPLLKAYAADAKRYANATPQKPSGLRKPSDLVAICGEQFLTRGLIEKFAEASAFMFDGVDDTYGGWRAFEYLSQNPSYDLALHDNACGIALFVHRRLSGVLPIHFFTIVLNGEPFIRYHEHVLSALPFDWHWHIVEGVASLVKDTAWSVATGGHIPDNLHNQGLSADGTSAYLDELVGRYPRQITVYRKSPSEFWDGKLEMVKAPLANIATKCLLWQIDSDELWSAEQICVVREAFLDDSTRTAAFFWCNYYVGERLGISTRYNYAQNPGQEWLRVWRFSPGMDWDAHEPPILSQLDSSISHRRNVAEINPFLHDETEHLGAVFDHFAYVTAAQVEFKESYYGYKNAVEQWCRLQEQGCREGLVSGHLREYLAWVHDETMFDKIENLNWTPLARRDPSTGSWSWDSQVKDTDNERAHSGRIVIDGVFFQLNKTGIARVWANLLQSWVNSGFAGRIVVLDRGGTAPRIDGLTYRSIPRHDIARIAQDSQYLQQICDKERASLFISTYYTVPIRTPSVFFGHDMIPEHIGIDLDDEWWRQKKLAITSAAGHIMVSSRSADDLVHFYPELDRTRVLVAYNSADPVFRPCSEEDVASFKARHSISREYILLVGEREGWKGYKNGTIVFAALTFIPTHLRPLLVCVGGRSSLSDVEQDLSNGTDVRFLALDDEELRCAYAGAQAYICPSLHEGFGLPIVEAMAVGCPVIAAERSVMPEIGGDAVRYFDPYNPKELASLILAHSTAQERQSFVERGRARAGTFSQTESARLVSVYLDRVIEERASGRVYSSANLVGQYYEAKTAIRLRDDRIGQLSETCRELSQALSQAARGSGINVGEISALVGEHPESAHDNSSTPLTGSAFASSAKLYPFLPRPDLRRTLRTSLEAVGLKVSEGPYPEMGIRKPFQWQNAPVLSLEVDRLGPAVATLHMRLGNLVAGQELRVEVNGSEIYHLAIPLTAWTGDVSFDLPLSLCPGSNVIQLEPTRCEEAAGERYFLIWYELEIL